MARRKSLVPSKRIRLDGYVRQVAVDIALDPREQKFLDWYLTNRENRKAFTVAKDMLCAMLNGELGQQVKVAVEQGNTQEAIEALQDLLGAFAE